MTLKSVAVDKPSRAVNCAAFAISSIAGKSYDSVCQRYKNQRAVNYMPRWVTDEDDVARFAGMFRLKLTKRKIDIDTTEHVFKVLKGVPPEPSLAKWIKGRKEADRKKTFLVLTRYGWVVIEGRKGAHASNGPDPVWTSDLKFRRSRVEKIFEVERLEAPSAQWDTPPVTMSKSVKKANSLAFAVAGLTGKPYDEVCSAFKLAKRLKRMPSVITDSRDVRAMGEPWNLRLLHKNVFGKSPTISFGKTTVADWLSQVSDDLPVCLIRCDDGWFAVVGGRAYCSLNGNDPVPVGRLKCRKSLLRDAFVALRVTGAVAVDVFGEASSLAESRPQRREQMAQSA